jgi:GNAT superfamily N-acetyltransferase
MSLGLWRLTRNDYAIRLYEALKRLGVTGTRMREWVAPLSDPDVVAAYESRPPPEDVSLSVVDAGTLDPADRADFADPAPEDAAVLARLDGADDEGDVADGGRLVGYLFVSERPVHVDALERDLTFDGAYVWRVFVDPDHRRRGIATALVARACRLARARGHETAHALIALDNRPSQWTFRACGFAPDRELAYYRVGGWSRRSTSPV